MESMFAIAVIVSVLMAFALVVVIAVIKDWEPLAIVFSIALLGYGCNIKVRYENPVTHSVIEVPAK